jgi:hypothetical protein
MESSNLQTLCHIASLRQRTREQSEEFAQTIQKMLAGTSFLQVLEDFSREEKIEVEPDDARSATPSRSRCFPPCTAS